MNIALIFAGGTGKRYSSTATPKQFLELHGKAIIVHSVEPFQRNPEIDGICVVCKSDWIDHFNLLKEKYRLNKVKWVVEGGTTSQESIYLGLNALRDAIGNSDDTIVLIHDGVRPLISVELISQHIQSVKAYGSAITVSKAIETVVQVDGNQIVGTLERSTCFHAKAPQSFYLKDILDLHERARQEGVAVIDAASLMLHYGKTLHSIIGSSENIKITTPVDYFLFKAIYEARESSQIFGVGYDR